MTRDEIELIDNDRRVLEAVDYAQSEWDGFIPHGSQDYVAIRRLKAAGLIEFIDHGCCQTCEGDEPHEGPLYVLTDAGRNACGTEAPAVTVTAETYGDHDDGPDVIVVRVRGEEVGAYCIADDPEAERRAMQRMVDALLAQGRAEMRERVIDALVQRRDRLAGSADESPHPHMRHALTLQADALDGAIALLRRALPDTSEESER